MSRLVRRIAVVLLALLVPIAAHAHAADDPFLGSWRLDFERSTIADDPGVKSKTFVFAPSADGVMITERVELSAEGAEPHVAQIPYRYSVPTQQPAGAGFDSLLVVKADENTAYWTAVANGQVVSQLQVTVSPEGDEMTFRYLWSAADPSGSRRSDRYVYVRQ